MSKKFQASFESLREYECPKWFLDAKFGIWSHWGPQSVPMYGDWYARHMYIEGSSQNLYHIRHYGHPSKFGYKDICNLWKAENFDADGLMDLYAKAGAKYFVGQAMHHDHFFNYPSKYNRFNSAQVGPMKDISGLWKAAADKQGLPFGLTEHLGATFGWWGANKGSDKEGPYAGVPYDGNDPEYRDFYLDNYEHANAKNHFPWYTTNKKFHEYWLNVIKEVIDLYQPDLLYSDGGLPFGGGDNGDDYSKGLEAVSYLYNTSIDKHGFNNAVYNQKDRNPQIFKVGVLDIEKSQLPDIRPDPWQTDTCIGNWFYDVRQNFKKPKHVVEMLIDIVSKNGNMLLNILQKPDGSIDDETLYLLQELAAWFKVCGEGIYGTRPWRISSEGTSTVKIDGFSEDAVDWNSSDYRFVKKDNKVYAFMLCPPDNGVAVIKSFTPDEVVKSVTLLGAGKLEFTQNFGALTIKLPEKLPAKFANCLAVEF